MCAFVRLEQGRLLPVSLPELQHGSYAGARFANDEQNEDTWGGEIIDSNSSTSVDPELAGNILNSLWIWRTRIVAHKESAIVPVKSRIANKVI